MIDLDELHNKMISYVLVGFTNSDISPIDAVELLTRLRQAEKDAARYRWIKANGQLGVGRCGVDWELYFEGSAPDSSANVERHIDEAMQCCK